MQNLKYISSLFVLLLFLGKVSAQDIRSNTKGFSLNLNGVYGSWNSESVFFGELDDLEPAGYGIGLKAAYGINQNIELMLAFSSLGFRQEFDWDSYFLGNLEIGGRYNFGATLRRVRPFLEVALSVHALNIDPITFDGINVFRLESSGVGFSAGGGLHFFFTENLSINANGKIAFGNFSTASLSGTEVNNLDEKLDFTITSLHIGLTYFFH
ncbi:MAG: outer membrane beta-barrel protein [Bacteroidia bacterium]|nr:outer membrane beta-barrel protein [Bacteroidia bacterium]